MKRLLSFLALCIPIYLFSQGFGSFSHDQPYLAKDRTADGGEAGTNIIWGTTNIYRWWVASDVPVGHVVSNQWADRVVGALMEQGDSSKRPTNTASGLYLDGSGQFLTNVDLNIGGASTRPMFLIVMNSSNLPVVKYIWTGATAPNTGFSANNGNWSYGDGAFGTKTANPTFPENRLFDMLMHEQDFYTNGVLNKTNLANNLGGGAPLKKLGLGEANDFPFKGYIREIIVWTNTGDTRPIASSTVSNLHYYATNRYGFSP